MISIAAGKSFGRVRLEAEGIYSNVKFDVVDTMAEISIQTGSIAALMANGHLDILESDNGTTYFGI